MPQFDINDYVQVNERLEKFRADHPTWGLVSELIHHDGTYFIVRAVVADDAGRTIATGFAEEKRGDGMVNRTSPLENCETSAWGRALANLGYDVRRSIASREEMDKSQRQQDSTGAGPGTPSPQGESREEAAGTGTGAPAAPSGDEPKYQKVMAIVEKYVYDADEKRAEANRQAFRDWLAGEKIVNDFAKMTDAQLNTVLAKVDPL